MPNPLQKLKAFIEKGARNNAQDAKAIQAIHDHSTSMGAKCATMSEAAGFSHTDLMTVLTGELKEDIDANAYILDIFDDTLVYSSGYSWSGSSADVFQISYSVADDGDVTWGKPIEVVRKVTYVPTNVDEPSMGESNVLSPIGDTLLIETDDTELIEYGSLVQG